MLVEKSEKRVFLPDFIQWLANEGLKVQIEQGYGNPLDLTFADYSQGNTQVTEVSREVSFQQDIVLILRSPSMEDFAMLGKNSIFISMFHFMTRPKRVAYFRDNNIRAISLDSIADNKRIRLVENMKSVAWNGLEAAFGVLEKKWPDFNKPDNKPIKTLIMGTGMVGKHAVEAATKFGNEERNRKQLEQKGNGSMAISIGRNITENSKAWEQLFPEIDVLVDATQRRNTSKPVILNSQLSFLPEHAVVVDLSVDPYDLNSNSPTVKGIEGMPQGSLDKYVFLPTDEDWENTVPNEISSNIRRTAVTCYSWPGVHPKECMEHYAYQLKPLMKALFDKGYDDLSPEGGYFEQALYNGTLKAVR